MPQTHQESKTARLQARLRPEDKDLFERAAALNGMSVASFVIASAREAATRAIERETVITLSTADSRAFVEALLSPREPAPALVRAMQRHQRILAPNG